MDVLVARAVALEAKRLSAGVIDHLEVANLVVPIMHVGLIQSIFELSRFQWTGLETLAPMWDYLTPSFPLFLTHSLAHPLTLALSRRRCRDTAPHHEVSHVDLFTFLHLTS